MTIQEMIENAVLDAVGLLDDEEQASFDRAFQTASPKIQAMIRTEQTRLSNLNGLLPAVDPPVSLRAEVLGKVREAIAATYLVEDNESSTRASMELIPSRRVSPIWRAAAIGSLAAALVFGVSVAQMTDHYDELRDAIGKDQLIEQITQQFSSRYVHDMMFDPDTARFVFASADTDFGGEAAVFFNPGWDKSRFFSTKLASMETERFRLAVIDENDQIVRELMEFDASGGPLDSEKLDFDPQEFQSTNRRLAVFPEDEQAEPLLRSVPIA